MKSLCIDPGTVQSAYIIWDTKQQIILDKGIIPNFEMLKVESYFQSFYEPYLRNHFDYQ